MHIRAFRSMPQQPLRLWALDSYASSFIACKAMCVCVASRNRDLTARMFIVHPARATAAHIRYTWFGPQPTTIILQHIQFIQSDAFTNSSKLNWVQPDSNFVSFLLSFERKQRKRQKARKRRKHKIEFLISTNFSFQSIRMNNNDTCFLFNDKQIHLFNINIQHSLYINGRRIYNENSERNVDVNRKSCYTFNASLMPR